MNTWFDAHLHLSDSRCLPWLSHLEQTWREHGIHGSISSAAFPDEWERTLPSTLPIHYAYGIHPWAAQQTTSEQLAHLNDLLQHNPAAFVGEVGLDGIRPTTDLATQHVVLNEQLQLAAAHARPVILHGAKRWNALFDALLPWASRLPALLLHGASFSPECLSHPLFRHSTIWFSFGTTVLRTTARTVLELAAAVPLNRLVIESDAPDGLPHGIQSPFTDTTGKMLNSSAILPTIGERLALLRGISIAEFAALTTSNAETFCQRN